MNPDDTHPETNPYVGTDYADLYDRDSGRVLHVTEERW